MEKTICINLFGTATTIATSEIYDILFEKMKRNVVHFTFFKKDGTLREAVVTRNLSVAEKRVGHPIPKPMGKRNIFAYYDIDKDAWRSFICENVCSIDKVE